MQLTTMKDIHHFLERFVRGGSYLRGYHLVESIPLGVVEVRLRVSWTSLLTPGLNDVIAKSVHNQMRPGMVAGVALAIVTTIFPPRWQWLWPGGFYDGHAPETDAQLAMDEP